MAIDTASALDLAAVRAAFPVLRDCVYLNTGTYGPMPEPALNAYINAVRAMEQGGVACGLDLGAEVSRTRERVADLIGAEPHEIAFTGNSTDGLNLALAGIDWREGDEVITTEEEHEALLHPLLYLQATRGIRIQRMPVSPDEAQTLETLDRLRSPATRLVAVSEVTCETGTRLPAAAICAWCRESGVLSLIDSTQSIGVYPVDAHAMGCDFLAGNGHKWLHGPTGSGIFYCRDGLLDLLRPAHVGAGSLEHADARTGAAEPWRSGQRFEFGTRPWTIIAGLGASLDWLDGLGWRNVARHIADLTTALKARLSERDDATLLTPVPWERSSGLVAFRTERGDAHAVASALRVEHGIHTRVVPHYNAIRIAVAHFVDRSDLDRLISALDRLRVQ